MLRAIDEVARAHNEAICFGLDPAEPLHWLDCCNELRPDTNSRRVFIRAYKDFARSPEVSCINL
jgi:hypothetical protein